MSASAWNCVPARRGAPQALEVIAEMEKRLERPLSCGQLAKFVGLSPRQLERLFPRYLDQTPTRYYLGLRLARARQLIRQTSMPILSIGLACGFCVGLALLQVLFGALPPHAI